MKAVQFTAWGGPEVVKINDIPKPAVGPGQVLVKVIAAGVNPVDWKMREGWLKDNLPIPLPSTFGGEIAGTIETVGDGVTGWAVGDRVFGAIGFIGAWAEYALADPALLAKIPDTISFAQAAATPVAIVTSAAALNAGNVGKGTRILIHAAAGGVGSLAVQMAKLRGAHVTALASKGNFDYVKSLGADEIVDRTTKYEDSLGKFDVVLDGFGPEAQARSWGLLKEGGALVTLVYPPSEDDAKRHKVTATMVFGTPNGEAIREVAAALASGKIKPPIVKAYPLDQANEALAEIQQGQVRGKLVLLNH